MALDLSDFGALQGKLNTQLGVSDWFTIAQADIDAFGELTKDRDAMHMDPDWARHSSPYGGTIAYGFQTLSMMTARMSNARRRSVSGCLSWETATRRCAVLICRR